MNFCRWSLKCEEDDGERGTDHVDLNLSESRRALLPLSTFWARRLLTMKATNTIDDEPCLVEAYRHPASMGEHACYFSAVLRTDRFEHTLEPIFESESAIAMATLGALISVSATYLLCGIHR